MMKGLSLEKKHLRQITVHTLVTTSCVGGFLTLLFGACIVPWIWAVVLWLVHLIPWWHRAGTFPNLFGFLASPSLRFGLIWLGYYLLAFLWAAAHLSPRQRMYLRAEQIREYEKTHGEWTLGTYTQPDPHALDEPLSQAWPGELKHQLVEHCYTKLREDLKRFHPLPLDLKTPETFYYQKGGSARWEGSNLVLPEEMLTPERIHELLPFLPGLLYDLNVERICEGETQGFPDYVPFALFLFFTGNFLWVPVVYKHGTEDSDAVNSAAQKKQHELERDTFTILLGQGPALEHQLRRIEEEVKRRFSIDKSSPTLVERIGHLEVLNEQERQEMRALGLTPKEPPLVMDSPFGQIGKSKKQRL